MNLNASARFSQNPIDIDIQRSRFDRTHRHKTTGNAGELIPIFCDEVLPGDTFDMTTASLARMTTPIHPTMDNAYLDTYFFFVPNRLIWQHWEAFNGQNDETYWTVPTEYSIPQLKFPRPNPDGTGNGWNKGSVADYFGIPTNTAPRNYDDAEEVTISALPFRAYVKIWNDWFRDQNVMNPAYFSTDDSTRDGLQAVDNPTIDERLNSALYGGNLLPVAKYHDYFTSALPAPQKGPGVEIGLNSLGQIPVTTSGTTVGSGDYPISFSRVAGLTNPGEGYLGWEANNSTGPLKGTLLEGEAEDLAKVGYLYPNNLIVDPTVDSKLSVLVNDLRLGFQLQKLYEKDARGGTRYIELIKSHFGVDSPDGRLQRSEYLGGSRQDINMQQVAQTSATNEISPQGNLSAYSLTIGANNSFIKSFTEHGYIIGVAAVRTNHTYQQGLNKMWSRKRRFDFYWPVLANIGEQPVLKKELYLYGEASADGSETGKFDDAFGYQEAWAEYRYHPDVVTGAFRSNYAQSLDSWHYADYFELGNDAALDGINLSAEFITETKNNIDRTLAVTSEVEDQFLFDFCFGLSCTRPMPFYSIPGLIDHH